jgi:hypothetical protein
VACPYLPTLDAYQQDLAQAGLGVLAYENVTLLWQKWVHERWRRFQQNQAHYRQKHGDDLVESYLNFYRAVADLFAGGNVGGVRIWGQRVA